MDSGNQGKRPMRRATREGIMAACAERERNGTAEPAHYGPAPVFADPKIQAVVAVAAKVQPVLTKMQPALAATQKAREAAHKAGAFKQMREVARVRRNASAPRKISRGHSARPATNKRTRGSRRVAVATASSGGGDPPDESDSEPPGEPSTVRRCSECDEEIVRGYVCRKAKCQKAAQRRCDRINPKTGIANGHTVVRGRCGRCGQYVKRPRSEWTVGRLRQPAGDAPSVGERTGGGLSYDHGPGPLDRDIYGHGGDAGVPFGERPLRVRPAPTYATIEDRTPDWRLLYVHKVIRGELTGEQARRKIASIEQDRKKAQREHKREPTLLPPLADPVEAADAIIPLPERAAISLAEAA